MPSSPTAGEMRVAGHFFSLQQRMGGYRETEGEGGDSLELSSPHPKRDRLWPDRSLMYEGAIRPILPTPTAAKDTASCISRSALYSTYREMGEWGRIRAPTP